MPPFLSPRATNLPAFFIGNSFSPLSLLPFATQEIPDNLPTYDPKIDLAQLTEVGTPEVTAVPFGAFTPFDVFERMKKEAGRVVQWEGMKVDLDRDMDVQMVGLSVPVQRC